jgi:hypothetical protein
VLIEERRGFRGLTVLEIIDFSKSDLIFEQPNTNHENPLFAYPSD